MRVVSLVLLVACGQSEQVLGDVPEKIEVSPILTDYQQAPVGGRATALVQIDHLEGAEVEIKNITIANIEGNSFYYEGLTDLNLPQDGNLAIEFVYAPVIVGYDRATVSITHTAEGSPTLIELRGQAILPVLTLFPLGLDFGAVPAGASSTMYLTVQNESPFDVSLTDGVSTSDRFSVDLVFPVEVPAGGSFQVPVVATPQDDDAVAGRVTLEIGELGLPDVIVRANDCDGGSPAAYDLDLDGVTSCAGDCDDENASIHPGAREVEDGFDDDCDGVADNGTPSADDDGDGYCEGPYFCADGTLPGDCNDGITSIAPDVDEDYFDGIDNDCDGVVDFGTLDIDEDGYAATGGDCDDENDERHPGHPEVVDGQDNDCNELIDDGTTAWDDDGDGWCEGPTCADESLSGDCDDRSDDVSPADGLPDGRFAFPGATELADWYDNDCDVIVDEGTVNYDDDGDGFTENGGDCDDTDDEKSPAFGNCP